MLLAMAFPRWCRVTPAAVLLLLFQFRLPEGHDLDLLPATHPVTNFCGSVCKFRLCEDDGRNKPLLPGARVPLRPAGKVSTPWVCLPGSKLGKIHRIGEARVRPVREIMNNIPISTYERNGLSPSFSPSFFSLAKIIDDRGPSFPGKYGIVRGESQGTQDQFLNELCVQIPIAKYDLKSDIGLVKSTVMGTERDDCIGFTTKVTQILVELTWDTNDDLDLSLLEPGGEVISFNGRISGTGGRLLREIGNSCKKRESGKEQIVYDLFSVPMRGMYEVQIRHYKSCPQNDSTRWYLSIYIDGELFFKTRNTSPHGPKDRFIRRRRFRFPRKE